ncbi:MAG TPA: hypothetical protein VEZ12_01515, partial [Herpetosiphonaceae bacterium]|nr:hypothetical protein [Herpetosiphonaceae bacterium]
MAVQAQPRSIVASPSPLSTLRVILAPIGQIFAFVLASAVILGIIVTALAAVIGRTTAQPNMVTGVVTLLPFVIIDGLVRGFLYATIALGYTMVYGVLEFINFAHGEIFMVGAYVGGGLAIYLAAQGALAVMPPLLFVLVAVLLGMAVSGGLAMAIERVAYRPLRGAPRLVPLISAIGVSLVLQDLVRLIAGPR